MFKKIQVSTSLTPNLLMHIFSCLEVEGSFYDTNYGMKHHFTLLEEEYELWQNNAKKCMTLGCNTELYAILFQIPSYIPAEDVEMILDSFDKISEAIEEGSIDSLITSYPELFDGLPIYAPKEIFDNHFKRLNEHKEIIKEIVNQFQQVLRGVWERFYSDYWENKALPKLLKKTEDVNMIIKPINIINSWQKVLGIEYPYNEFIALLVEPTTTIATNLLAEKIVISANLEDLEIYRILVQEVGRSFLLNTSLFEHEKLKAITESNVEKLSLIVDAACIYLKRTLFETLRIRPNEPDPYIIQGIQDVIQTFGTIWESMMEKDIMEALVQTYNKLTPIV
ncbi:MAG: hypothetical protein EAX90_02790 [Candidatus Heimdallarchaeota archaeon]|nr:hypothetical protein [Candidatus Heimdallarchaeota archaeon]